MHLINQDNELVALVPGNTENQAEEAGPSTHGAPWVIAARTGTQITVEDAVHDERFRDAEAWFEKSACQAAIATPLRAWDGRLIGVLTLCYRSPRVHTASAARLAEIFSAPLAEIIDRKQSEEMLRQEVAARDEWVEFVSHEVKNPLMSVVGLLRQLAHRHTELEPEELSATLLAALEDAERLQSLFENLKVLSSADNGDVSLEPVDLGTLVHSIATRHRQRHPGRRLSVEAQGTHLIEGRKSWLVQVLDNLLENACKYTPAEAEILIRVEQKDSLTRLEVHDGGAGIEEIDLPLIFEPFYRTGDGRRQATGSGLGLAICQRLVALQKGRIAAGRSPLGGALFTMEFSTLS